MLLFNQFKSNGISPIHIRLISLSPICEFLFLRAAMPIELQCRSLRKDFETVSVKEKYLYKICVVTFSRVVAFQNKILFLSHKLDSYFTLIFTSFLLLAFAIFPSLMKSEIGHFREQYGSSSSGTCISYVVIRLDHIFNVCTAITPLGLS